MLTSLRTRRYTAAAIIALAALAFAAPKPAAASSCSTYLGKINTWFTTQPEGKGTYAILATMIQMDSARSFSAYGEGPAAQGNNMDGAYLMYHAAANGFPAYIQDQGAKNYPLAEYFSERRYYDGLISLPFSPSQTDSLGSKIYLQDASGKSITAGDTIFTLYSWGNGQFTVNMSCTDGMLYGFYNGSQLFALHLTESFTNNRPPPAPPRQHVMRRR
jgi:hypothetical protein